MDSYSKTNVRPKQVCNSSYREYVKMNSHHPKRDVRPQQCYTRSDDGDNNLSFIWNVTSLKPIPMYHPIQRNTLKIEGLPLNYVSLRICKFINLHGIHGSFGGTKQQHVGRVHCLCENLIQFTIQLWQGQSPNTILIEVSRIQGCSIELQRIRDRLYHAIVTGKQEETKLINDPDSSRECRIPRTRTTSTKTLTTTTTTQIENINRYSKSLERAFNLLQSNNRRHNLLGMKYLIFLTDPSKGVMNMNLVSPLSLNNKKNQSHSNYLQNCIMNYLKRSILNSNNNYDLMLDGNNDETFTIDDRQCNYFREIHLLSLHVLSNILKWLIWKKDTLTTTNTAANMESLSTTSSDHDNVKNFSSCISSSSSSFFLNLSSSFLERDILPILLHNVELVWKQPLVTAVSLRCIHLLQILQPTTIVVANEIVHRRLLAILEVAHHYGKMYHLGLQKESRNLMKISKQLLHDKVVQYTKIVAI